VDECKPLLVGVSERVVYPHMPTVANRLAALSSPSDRRQAAEHARGRASQYSTFLRGGEGSAELAVARRCLGPCNVVSRP